MARAELGWEAFRRFRVQADLSPRPLRLSRQARTDRGRLCPGARRPAGALPLASRAARSDRGRRARAHRRRLVERRRRTRARLFPRRGQGGAALLAVSRGTLSRHGARPCRGRAGSCTGCMREHCTRYVEFAVASNFSFLRGASHPEELMLQAAQIGLDGLGLCDRNSVAGVVRAHLIKREQELDAALSPGRAARLRRRHAGHSRLSARPRRPGAGSAACSRAATCARRKANASFISTICSSTSMGSNWS